MQLNFTHKKLGIWGLGISGKSIISYLQQYCCSLSVLEKHITAEIQALCAAQAIQLYQDEPATCQAFLKTHDLIIASPGVDLRLYQNYAHKFIAEADLFYLAWKQKKSEQEITHHCPERKILGITGTLGKTSITHLLTTLLTNAGISLATGGNIGTGMLDLMKSNAEYALLELSSFQLEYCRHFVSDGAVITNIYPNHLDRHETMEQYVEAKKQILIRQRADAWTLVPLELAEELRNDKRLENRNFAFFISDWNKRYEQFLKQGDIVYRMDTSTSCLDTFCCTNTFAKHSILVDKENLSLTNKKIILSSIPTLSYPQNWLIIAAVLDLMGLNAANIITQAGHLSLPSYRLEEVATVNNTTYYNDSKSTIMQATLAAVDSLNGKNIILLLGGVSKGVDRTPFVQQLKDKVTHVICFGKEAEQLYAACATGKIPATTTRTLEEAVICAQKYTQQNTAILLSPGGASYDLFKDYQARGACFKNLIHALSH